MYYLNWVTKCIGLDILYDALIDYINYQRLTKQGTTLVLSFAQALNPRELIGQVIFRDDEGTITRSSSNEFCSINVACNIIHVEQEAIIGGRAQNITKVMFFKSSWLDYNYYRPMARLTDQRNRCIILEQAAIVGKKKRGGGGGCN